MPLPDALDERCVVRPTLEGAEGTCVLYWMRVALRAWENPALDVALVLAKRLGVPLVVVQGLSERYRYASDRHHTFILQGARDVAAGLASRGIRYALHVERPGHRVRWLPRLAAEAAVVVTEDLPIEPLRRWTRTLMDAVTTPVWTVDAANVVPAPVVQGRHQRAFRFREAIERPLDARVSLPWEEQEVGETSVGAVGVQLPFAPVDLDSVDLAELVAACAIDHSVGPVPHTPGGSDAGYARWAGFAKRLRAYGRTRNDPLKDGVSRMSAYLHYGMVAPTRLAREAHAIGGKGAEKYLDELVVWRELANHWCRHHEAHDTLAALPGWAVDTLRAHAGDRRPAVHDLETLSRARTTEPLWDACQLSLLRQGELHNNVRMTWGKALPLWTATPEEAVFTLFELNNRYALDGRDPSSVAGLQWCLGLLDRPFSPEVEVLGAVRPRPVERHAERLDVDAYRAITARSPWGYTPRVAVVGGGVAGAFCARTLQDHGLHVQVFDKGRGAGGRLSTRRSEPRTFDHGAPGFSIRDRRVGRSARSWRARGVIARWEGPFGVLGTDGFAEEDWGPRFVGTPGMNAVVKHLLADVSVTFGARVEGVRRTDGGWTLDIGQAGTPTFDAVVVAVPAPQAVPLLQAAPALAQALAEVRVAPCWAVLAECPSDDHPFAAARVQGSPLGFVARNHSKPGRGEAGAWVLHGTPEWSQEHLEDDPEAVARALVAALRERVELPEPSSARAHRWRFARVLQPVGQDCLWDDALQIGACGDALLGGRVEDAMLSGQAMAGRILGSLRPRPF